jgi:hypothetical protein
MRRCATIREVKRSAVNLARRLFVGILLLSAAVGEAPASEIYKSIDANGNVVYSDHLESSMSQPTVVQLETPGLPPHELHFCWTNCFTLILDNGVYHRADGTDESWTVETFSPKNVVLHRHDAPADWNGYSQDVVYAGQVSYGRLIGITVNGKPISGIDASWGIALNTLPGSNAERDAKSPANPNSQSSGTVSTAATPPPLPEEDQPTLPEDGDLWTPGYWYWRGPGYVWISGAWVRPPRLGFLWTPPYWVSAGTVFVFHPGHWGPTVDFYGGVNYGYGYFGNGYTGGHWVGNAFAYNSAINHLNPAVAHHTYAEPVPYQGSPNRGSPNRGSPNQGAPNQGARSVSSFAAGARGGAATPTVAVRQSLPRALNKPATTVQRTSEPAPNAIEKKPPTGVSTPAPTVPAKVNRVMPARAVPVKQ